MPFDGMSPADVRLMPSTRSVASAIIGTEIAAAIAAESAAAEAAAARKTLHDLNDDTLAVCASHLRTQEAWALACISKLVRVAASRDAAWHARVHAWQRRAPLRSWLRRARQRIQQRRVVPHHCFLCCMEPPGVNHRCHCP